MGNNTLGAYNDKDAISSAIETLDDSDSYSDPDPHPIEEKKYQRFLPQVSDVDYISAFML